jgi:predicted acetyltransferase
VLPTAAVTEVGVLPTHRRRGVLTAIMGALLDQAVERNEPVASLTASESTIYRRYGYGVGARRQTLTVDTTRSAELVDIAAPGRLRLVTEQEAAPLLPAAWSRHWPGSPGEVSRNPAWWEALAMDPEDDRDGASARYLVVHEDPAGEPDGFAAYRLKYQDPPEWFDLHVVDFAAADPRVEAALLRYLMDVDLVHGVRWRVAPIDLALRWRLVDSRGLKVDRELDHLWVRPLDVPRCLAARSYAAEGGGVVEVVDRRRPEVGGCFGLDAGPDGADCVRVTVSPDVTLDVADLGSLLLSGVSWVELQRAGLVEEHTAGTVDRLDALFRPSRAPHCATGF